MKNFLEILYVKTVIMPIAKHFWDEFDKIDAIVCNNIDSYAAKTDAIDALRAEYKSLPTHIRSRLDKVTRTMVS